MLRLFLILALVKSLTGVTYARPKIPGVDINGVVHPITVQTLVEIGTEKNSTIVFPLPVDIISSISKVLEAAGGNYELGKPAAPSKIAA